MSTVWGIIVGLITGALGVFGILSRAQNKKALESIAKAEGEVSKGVQDVKKDVDNSNLQSLVDDANKDFSSKSNSKKE